ncbi:Predicted dioxygenase of extradiol dioxygenase family [Cribrihabitans marinus]|uniref:Predicted dioxygenase of extradiol dioxygenase family n=1 Tax=Cribrihabitans marinus TaxID=1227549 RepID=A0A1H7CX73_9RHOB|nr:VOC family protein [Cribrihabitans marinus]GGH36951.1 glyoxalase [Cribrihabitans marinus]SEJ94323.1 Predicted dioxygenase of extradiol dioxygenase family [Cribrihabitans marinus]
MLALDHIQIAMPAGGEEAARTFWCEGLGLTERPKPEALRARGGLWLALDGAELHLGVEEGFAPARKAHPGFAVKDIDAVAARIEALGQTPRWDGTIENRRRFFAEDPFGNRLEFLQTD